MDYNVNKYNRMVYPAIFHKAEEGGYWVEFPDLHCVTEGDTLTEAFNMAGDCLLAAIGDEDVASLPSPTPLEAPSLLPTCCLYSSHTDLLILVALTLPLPQGLCTSSSPSFLT